jgi:replication initiation protein RepC
MVIDNGAQEASWEGFASTTLRASGCRRITLEMRAWLDRADRFEGLPRGTAKPLTFLHAFKEAEPYLGLPAHTYKLIDWLVRFTKPQDWEESSRPIAWPSAQRQQEFLHLSAPRVKALNRALFEAGIFVIRDNPQGRRYGRRDDKGRIIEAYGFDLSPLVQRYNEFVRIAAAAQVERERMRQLRRRTTLARRAVAQAAEELGLQGYDGDELRQLVRDTAELVTAAKGCRCSEDLALAVKGLESRQNSAETLLRQQIKSVEIDPMGLEKKPHIIDTTLTNNDLDHTVIASKKSSRAERAGPSKPLPPHRREPPAPYYRVTASQLLELAPRLGRYVPPHSYDFSFDTIVEAAFWLAGEMDISPSLWARACQLMGRETAAVALATVSTRPAGHYTSGPGGYFAGMLRKFEKGELHLERTLWRLKDQIWGSKHQQRTSR